MTYATPQALRMALEQRLLRHSTETGISLDRLRRRVVFERVIARLQSAEPGVWVLKGGMALEVRLHDDARLTKDLDLGLRTDIADADDLHDRLIDALSVDPDGDRFEFTVEPPRRLREDVAGRPTWRARTRARLAGKDFGSLQLDISPRAHELDDTDVITLPNSLEFAGIAPVEVEIVDVHRHGAEKLHAMVRDFGERENSRVRDLVDIVILIEHGLLDTPRVGSAVRQVWAERENAEPPETLPPLPESWPDRYERLVAEYDIKARTFSAALDLVDELWYTMVRSKKNSPE